jgi:hypothetical protein
MSLISYAPRRVERRADRITFLRGDTRASEWLSTEIHRLRKFLCHSFAERAVTARRMFQNDPVASQRRVGRRRHGRRKKPVTDIAANGRPYSSFCDVRGFDVYSQPFGRGGDGRVHYCDVRGVDPSCRIPCVRAGAQSPALAYVAAVIGPFAIPMLYCVAAISAFRKMIHPKKPDATISHREFPRCTLSGPRSTTAVRPYIEPFISEGRDIRRVRRPDRPAIAAQ